MKSAPAHVVPNGSPEPPEVLGVGPKAAPALNVESFGLERSRKPGRRSCLPWRSGYPRGPLGCDRATPRTIPRYLRNASPRAEASFPTARPFVAKRRWTADRLRSAPSYDTRTHALGVLRELP